MTQKYYQFAEILELIDKPNQSACKKLYEDHKNMFDRAAGSTEKHQAWEGGYLDHVREISNIAIRLYANMSECRMLPFSLSDSLLVLFLHDLEKPWKYAGSPTQKAELARYDDYKDFIRDKAREYGFALNHAHENALEYVHGEWKDYDPRKRIQLPLAAFIHCCDTISARIWFDEPRICNAW